MQLVGHKYKSSLNKYFPPLRRDTVVTTRFHQFDPVTVEASRTCYQLIRLHQCMYFSLSRVEVECAASKWRWREKTGSRHELPVGVYIHGDRITTSRADGHNGWIATSGGGVVCHVYKRLESTCFMCAMCLVTVCNAGKCAAEWFFLFCWSKHRVWFEGGLALVLRHKRYVTAVKTLLTEMPNSRCPQAVRSVALGDTCRFAHVAKEIWKCAFWQATVGEPNILCQWILHGLFAILIKYLCGVGIGFLD